MVVVVVLVVVVTGTATTTVEEVVAVVVIVLTASSAFIYIQYISKHKKNQSLLKIVVWLTRRKQHANYFLSVPVKGHYEGHNHNLIGNKTLIMTAVHRD